MTPKRVKLKNTKPQSASDVAFGFVQSLAAELSLGHVDLPSFPEIAVRVRRVLSDPNSSVDKVVRVVGSEPALSARLLRIANSASLNPSGKQITDLRTAVNRMGYNMVRSASMSFALAQVRNNSKLACVKHYLDDLWERSILVAAFAFVVARTCTKVNPDEAMLTGMMHGIGQLYVLTRAADHPELFNSVGTLHVIINDWQAQIGNAILENWEFAEEMVQAVADQHNLARKEVETADLSDIVAIAVLMASFVTDLVGLQLALQGLPAVQRLGLDETKTLAVMREFDAEVEALRKALGT
jgi:HD-like signal output (HDOD) protein